MLSCPLFGWRTTNFVESDNNTMLVNRMRDSTPLEALKILAKAAINKFSMRQDQQEKWTAQHLTVTPRARALYQTKQSTAGNYKMASSFNGVWFASKQGYVNIGALKLKRWSARFLRTDKWAYLAATYSPCYMRLDLCVTWLQLFIHRTWWRILSKDTWERQSNWLSVLRPLQCWCIHHYVPRMLEVGKKRRIGSSGDTKPGATYKCRLFKQEGHNRTTCRRHANPAAREPETIFGHAVDLDDVVGSVISVPLVATNFEKANTILS